MNSSIWYAQIYHMKKLCRLKLSPKPQSLNVRERCLNVWKGQNLNPWRLRWMAEKCWNVHSAMRQQPHDWELKSKATFGRHTPEINHSNVSTVIQDIHRYQVLRAIRLLLLFRLTFHSFNSISFEFICQRFGRTRNLSTTRRKFNVKSAEWYFMTTTSWNCISWNAWLTVHSSAIYVHLSWIKLIWIRSSITCKKSIQTV